MKVVLVVDQADEWQASSSSFPTAAAEVISADDYVTSPRWITIRRVRVINLCRSYRYQSTGYYVSLVAAARGHQPMPSVVTIQDLRYRSLMRSVSEDLDELVQRGLRSIESDDFTLSVYFGQNMAERHRGLARALFNLFPAPLLRSQFKRQRGEWRIESLRLLGSRDVPEGHREYLAEAAGRYLAKRQAPPKASGLNSRYDIAFLVDPKDDEPPSDEAALRKFERVGESMGLGIHRIVADDFGSLAEYDGLFIRETTLVADHTYRFSRRAAAEGLVVIDDPESIIRCTNKIYVAEVLAREKIGTPRSAVLSAGNLDQAFELVGSPCVLKLPDGSFSSAVKKVETALELRQVGTELLQRSDYILAQEFLPSEYDWRVGVLDRQVLFVCRYHMAKGHWQIIARAGNRTRYGKVDTIAPEEVPPQLLEVALRAANLIGGGLYGVDLKMLGERVVVIEVNDNPNLDAGYEDALLGDELYRRVLQYFVDRLDRRSQGSTPRGLPRGTGEERSQ